MDEIEVRVDISKLTVGDLELLERAGHGEVRLTATIDVLERVVEGGVRHLPALALEDIISAVAEELERARGGNSTAASSPGSGRARARRRRSTSS